MHPQQFKRGDILLGSLRGSAEARHPIIYLTSLPQDNWYFIGVMLTHASSFSDNELLPSQYIKAKHLCENCEGHFSTDKPSYIVKRQFYKPNDWGPFKKVRELTEEGIEYVERLVKEHEPQHYVDYIAE